MVVDYEHCLDCINDSTHYILYMIDYNLIMWIGLGLIVGGFCLFLYSQMRLRQLDIEEFKNQQLTESFNKAKNDSR